MPARAQAQAFRPRCERLEDRWTPAAGDLDLSLSGDGVAFATTHAGAKDLAVQPDGAVVSVGLPRHPGYYGQPGGFAVARHRPDGSLDPNFGNGGWAVSNFARMDGYPWAVAVQPDGKILVGGPNMSNWPREYSIAVIRYNANGTPDKTFGKNGLVQSDLTRSSEEIRALVVQPDGKIVAVGHAGPNAVVIRYTATGQLDRTFDGDGWATVPGLPNGGPFTYVRLLPDGRILAGGAGTLARLHPNGSLDTSFGAGGIVTAAQTTETNGLAIRPDGRIVTATTVIVGGVPPDTFRIVSQYLPNGSPDLTFGLDHDGNGVRDGFTSISGSAHFDLALDTAGRVVTAGRFYNPASTVPPQYGDGWDFAVFRYTPDGLPDPAFGTDGMAADDLSGTYTQGESYGCVDLAPDGKIVAGGSGTDPGTGLAGWAVGRYLSDDPPPAPALFVAPPWDLDPDADDPWDVTTPFVG